MVDTFAVNGASDAGGRVADGDERADEGETVLREGEELAVGQGDDRRG